jgi:hypothetical protein
MFHRPFCSFGESAWRVQRPPSQIHKKEAATTFNAFLADWLSVAKEVAPNSDERLPFCKEVTYYRRAPGGF